MAVIRADWGSVTLAEYAALDVIWCADPELILNATWDEMDTHNPFSDGTPTRLTDDGRAWLAGLRETVTTTFDEREQIRAARELVRSMGTLVTMAAKRRTR
jgi:hypothetical protein